MQALDASYCADCEVDCGQKCWANSKFVSTCTNETKCFCEDAEFQSVSLDAFTQLIMVHISAPSWTNSISRLYTNASIPNAKLLSSDLLFTTHSRNALRTAWTMKLLLHLSSVNICASARLTKLVTLLATAPSLHVTRSIAELGMPWAQPMRIQLEPRRKTRRI